VKQQWPSGEEVCREIRRQTDTVCLWFSCGKDSCAAALELRKHFPNIVFIYKYLVPDLPLVEASLKYFEGFFGTRIWRLPHPGMYKTLNRLIYQTPDRCNVIEDFELPEPKDWELRDSVCDDLKLPLGTWTALGTRMVDSPVRKYNISRTGPLNYKEHIFLPIYDKDKAWVVKTIRESLVMLPPDYALFGRSLDAFDNKFLGPLQRNCPVDYQKILDWYPLARLQCDRHKWFLRRLMARHPSTRVFWDNEVLMRRLMAQALEMRITA